MPDTILTECAQPLFYYFLRKTGDPTAAEDLSADVLLAVLAAIPSQVLHEQMNYVASNEICNSRMMVINDCLADGTLTLPEKPEASTVGMWIELR